MVINKLTDAEFEKILKPIIKLDEIEVVKSNIYSILHFTKTKPTDPAQFIINSKFTGILSTYKGFELEIKRLDDAKNGFIGVIISFKRKRKLIDNFTNPTNPIFYSLKKMCEAEILDGYLVSFTPVKPPLYGKEEFWYQSSALNPGWKVDNKISPLTLYLKDVHSILVEFNFFPQCYERKSNKTVLKDNWLEILSLYTPVE